MRLDTTRKRGLRLPLTPLIDVVFLLLLFFMLSSTFLDYQKLDLNVAGARGGAATQSAMPVIVKIGTAHIDVAGRQVALKDIAVAIDSASSRDLGRRILVRPDSDVAVQRLLYLLEAIAAGGYTNVLLQETR